MGVAHWNDEQDAELRRLISAGESYSGAATAVNNKFGTSFSRNAAIGRGHRLKLDSVKRRQPVKIRTKPAPLPRAAKARATVRDLFKKPDVIKVASLAEIPQPAPSHAIDLIALNEDTCHFPYGNGPFSFCGHPVKVGSSYCLAHHIECHDRRYVVVAAENEPATPSMHFEAA